MLYPGTIRIWPWYDSTDKTHGGSKINTSSKLDAMNNDNIRKNRK